MPKRINIEKLLKELEAAGVPVECVRTSDPQIDYKPEATTKQRQDGAAVLAAHDPDALMADEQAKRDDLAPVALSEIAKWLSALDDEIKAMGSIRTAIVQEKATTNTVLTLVLIKPVIIAILDHIDKTLEYQQKADERLQIVLKALSRKTST